MDSDYKMDAQVKLLQLFYIYERLAYERHVPFTECPWSIKFIALKGRGIGGEIAAWGGMLIVEWGDPDDGIGCLKELIAELEEEG